MVDKIRWFCGVIAAAGIALLAANATGFPHLGGAADIIGIVSIIAGVAVKTPWLDKPAAPKA